MWQRHFLFPLGTPQIVSFFLDFPSHHTTTTLVKKVSAANIVKKKKKKTHQEVTDSGFPALILLYQGPSYWIFLIKDGEKLLLSSKATPLFFYILLSTKGQEESLYVPPVLSIFQGR